MVVKDGKDGSNAGRRNLEEHTHIYAYIHQHQQPTAQHSCRSVRCGAVRCDAMRGVVRLAIIQILSGDE